MEGVDETKLLSNLIKQIWVELYVTVRSSTQKNKIKWPAMHSTYPLETSATPLSYH